MEEIDHSMTFKNCMAKIPLKGQNQKRNNNLGKISATHSEYENSYYKSICQRPPDQYKNEQIISTNNIKIKYRKRN